MRLASKRGWLLLTAITLAAFGCKTRDLSKLRDIDNRDLEQILAGIEGKAFDFRFVESLPDTHSDKVTAIAMDREAKFLVSADASGAVVVWNLATRQPVARTAVRFENTAGAGSFEDSSEMIRALDAWAPPAAAGQTALLIVVGGKAGRVAKLTFDTASGNFSEPLVLPEAHRRIVHDVDIAFDGMMFASSSSDGSIFYWHSPDPFGNSHTHGKLIPPEIAKNTQASGSKNSTPAVEVIEVLPDHTILAARGPNLEYWNPKAPEKVVYPFGRNIVEAPQDFDINVRTRANQAPWISSMDSMIRPEEGTRFLEILVAVGDEAGVVKAFRRRVPPPESAAVRDIRDAWDPDRVKAAIILSEMSPLLVKANVERVGGLRFSADGSYLMTGGLGMPINQSFQPGRTTEGLLRLWKVEPSAKDRGRLRVRELRRLYVPTASRGIAAIAGSNSRFETYLLDESANNRIYRWNIAAMNAPLAVTNERASNTSFSTDGRLLVASFPLNNDTDALRVWDVNSFKRSDRPGPTAAPIATLQDDGIGSPIDRISSMLSLRLQAQAEDILVTGHCDGSATLWSLSANGLAPRNVGAEALSATRYQNLMAQGDQALTARTCSEGGYADLATKEGLLYVTYPTKAGATVTIAWSLQAGAPHFHFVWEQDDTFGLKSLQNALKNLDRQKLPTDLIEVAKSQKGLLPSRWPGRKGNDSFLITLYAPIPEPLPLEQSQAEQDSAGEPAVAESAPRETDSPTATGDTIPDAAEREAAAAAAAAAAEQERLIAEARAAERQRLEEAAAALEAAPPIFLVEYAARTAKINDRPTSVPPIAAAALSPSGLWFIAATDQGELHAISATAEGYQYTIPLDPPPGRQSSQVLSLAVSQSELVAVARVTGLEIWWAGQDYRFLGTGNL